LIACRPVPARAAGRPPPPPPPPATHSTHLKCVSLKVIIMGRSIIAEE
jgi:hypothetical protein